MANRTDKEAASIHGTNPQNLVDKIVRDKIYATTYWKEQCFGLSAETLVDKAVALRAAGGTYGGGQKPTEFLCLILKMLQIQPDKAIVIEFIKSDDYKYVRLLGAFYLRLTGRPLEVYQYLEPLYNDYRKVRLRQGDGSYSLSHVDAVIDEMLGKDYLFGVTLPRIPARHALEAIGKLEPRVSVLDEEFDEIAVEAEAHEAEAQAEQLRQELSREGGPGKLSLKGLGTLPPPPSSRHRSRSRSRSPDRRRDRSRSRERHRERSRSRERGDRRRERSRSRSRERRRDRRDREEGERDRSRERDGRRDKDRSDRARERERDRDGDRGRDGERDRGRSDKHGGGGGGGGREIVLGEGPVEISPDDIAGQNALRAKLGLKPLRP